MKITESSNKGRSSGLRLENWAETISSFEAKTNQIAFYTTANQAIF